MGNRLTKIYTRTGDAGDTGTARGERVAKDDVLIHAQGDIDELNSVLGLLACELDAEQRAQICHIQHALFDIGGEISLGAAVLTPERVTALEQSIDDWNRALPVLKEFILPGGNKAGACCHLARTVCRRAERSLITLHRTAMQNPVTLAYINRLSDYLFVLARVLNGGDEIYWQSEQTLQSTDEH
jgi:cob(I)alamin adenosyltransferase